MRLALVCLLLIGLSGCLDPSINGGGTGESNVGEAVPGDEGDKPGSADGDAGSVRVREESDRWVATRTDTAKGPYLSGADILVDTVNGYIELDASASSGYTVSAHFSATGDTRQQAIDRLATLGLDIGDSGGLSVVAKAYSGDWSNKQASLDVAVAHRSVGDLETHATNGRIEVSGLEADNVQAKTTNGQISGAIDAHDVDLDTTNGAIDWAGDVADLTVDTSNAAIELDIRPIATGTWSIKTTNGRIDLSLVEDSSRGYDVSGKTTNGQVNFNFKDTQEMSSNSSFTGDEKREKTVGYETRNIQIDASLTTVNGSITGSS